MTQGSRLKPRPMGHSSSERVLNGIWSAIENVRVKPVFEICIFFLIVMFCKLTNQLLFFSRLLNTKECSNILTILIFLFSDVDSPPSCLSSYDCPLFLTRQNKVKSLNATAENEAKQKRWKKVWDEGNRYKVMTWRRSV